MKFSEQWLRERVNPATDTQELMDQITMAGLEVDGFEPVAGQFSGVIVGEVLSVSPHPDADKLRVCQVSDGAPDGTGGLRCPQRPRRHEGAVCRGGCGLARRLQNQKAKLRGQPSEGMLCSESEPGLSDSHDGLMELPDDAPVGQELSEFLKLNDVTIDVDLTPNRSDCLSIKGIARKPGY